MHVMQGRVWLGGPNGPVPPPALEAVQAGRGRRKPARDTPRRRRVQAGAAGRLGRCFLSGKHALVVRRTARYAGLLTMSAKLLACL